MANSSPIVEAFDQILFVNAFTAASDMFTYSDPENDPALKYRFFDLSANPDSGLFELNGVPRANGQVFEIFASQLSSLFYRGGSRIGNEGIEVSAYDGTTWSLPSSLTAYSVVDNENAPILNVSDTSVVGNETILASSFISAYDPDGWPIEKYYLRDRLVNHSFFSLDGTAFAQGEYFTVTADQFERLEYNGVFKGTEAVDAFAWDGADWSPSSTGLVQTVFNANRPVGQYNRVIVPQNELTPMEGNVSFIDVEENTAKFYSFYDSNPHSHSGGIVRKGVLQPSKTWITVKAEDLGTVEYLGASRTYGEKIRFRVYDGRYWSPIETIEFDNIPIPVLGGPRNAVTRHLGDFGVGQMFTKLDNGPQHLTYEVYDSNTDPISGNLELNGVPIDSGVIHTLDNATFYTELSFKAGPYEKRPQDDIYVRAYNGTFNGEWERVTMRGEPEYDQALFSGADWGQYILKEFPEDKLIVTYSFMQQFPDYETGEAEDSPNNDPPRPFSQFTPDQRVGARRAFQMLESFANIDFVEVADTITDPVSGDRGGTLRMGNYRLETPDAAAAFAFFPSPEPEGGDMWFNDLYVPKFGWQEGSSAYTIFLHELGHAMGMEHPFVLPGDPQKAVLPPQTDNRLFTVMAYIDTAAGSPWSYSLYDISELQRVYGANETFAAGDDVYDIAGFFNGDTTPYWSIWDTDGNDTLSAVGSSIDSVVDLRAGTVSSIGDRGNNITIAFGVTIENGIGSDNNDTLVGNEEVNNLIGNAGNDSLQGLGGDDFVSGGAGSDRYLWGVADGNDRINEAAGAGRDRLVLSPFPGMDDITEDLNFRLSGNDLIVELTLGEQRPLGRVTIEKQELGKYRLESLEIDGELYDLVSLTQQATTTNQKFTGTGVNSLFGQLVVPV